MTEDWLDTCREYRTIQFHSALHGSLIVCGRGSSAFATALKLEAIAACVARHPAMLNVPSGLNHSVAQDISVLDFVFHIRFVGPNIMVEQNHYGISIRLNWFVGTSEWQISGGAYTRPILWAEAYWNRCWNAGLLTNPGFAAPDPIIVNRAATGPL